MPEHALPSSARRPLLVTLALWGLAFGVGSTLPSLPLRADEIKRADEIIRALSGQTTEEADESAPRLRGILPRRRPSEPPPAHRIDVTVHFATDSAEIEPRSRIQIEEIARAVGQLDLSHARLLIIGHSDSRGPAPYNQALSLRRARAVKDALVNDYAVAGDGLVAEGKGESELLVHPERTPEDYAKNRRVELRLEREPQPNE